MGHGPAIRNGKKADIIFEGNQPTSERDLKMLRIEFNNLSIKYEELKSKFTLVSNTANLRARTIDELRLEIRNLKARLDEPSMQAALKAADAIAKNETEEWYRAHDGVWRQKGVKPPSTKTRGRPKKNYELSIPDDLVESSD